MTHSPKDGDERARRDELDANSTADIVNGSSYPTSLDWLRRVAEALDLLAAAPWADRADAWR